MVYGAVRRLQPSSLIQFLHHAMMDVLMLLHDSQSSVAMSTPPIGFVVDASRLQLAKDRYGMLQTDQLRSVALHMANALDAIVSHQLIQQARKAFECVVQAGVGGDESDTPSQVGPHFTLPQPMLTLLSDGIAAAQTVNASSVRPSDVMDQLHSPVVSRVVDRTHASRDAADHADPYGLSSSALVSPSAPIASTNPPTGRTLHLSMNVVPVGQW
jgi:hypothetical protein